MNRQYRRKLEKLQKKEYNLFLKKNKNFLNSIKGEGGTQETLQKIKNLLDEFENKTEEEDIMSENKRIIS